MCPFFSPFIFLLLICGPIFLLCSAANWSAKFNPEALNTKFHMGRSESVELKLEHLNYTQLIDNKAEIYVKSNDDKLATVYKQIGIEEISQTGNYDGTFDVHAEFMGTTHVFVEIQNKIDGTTEKSDTILPLIIIREETVLNHIFTGSVATLVSILYINFGAALDLTVLKGILKKPIGPAIGFFGQFVVMPVLSYVLGLILFPNNVEMQIGMFFTGCSPAGGASNMWTVILGGNIDLSISMTTISTIASFGMMPLWLFTLGKVIFESGDMDVPYRNLATYVIGLIIPLAIGMLIKRYLPRVGNFLVRILKVLSVILILFIVIFAIVTNLYLFELFSWEIIVAGLCLPWIAYVLGWSAAKLFRQNSRDALAIALETGIQNTGISIFILRASLDQPQADLTTIVPVTVAIMTPIPLIILYIGQKIRNLILSKRNGSANNIEPADTSESGTIAIDAMNTKQISSINLDNNGDINEFNNSKQYIYDTGLETNEIQKKI